jgi:YhcH/YjgK/YiaL family protein
MICGKLCDFEDLGLETLGPATRQAVAWIRSLPTNPSEGSFELPGALRALIIRYPTTTEPTGRFETHRRFVDLQYTLAGCEALEWTPRDSLIADGDYEEATDLCFYFGSFPLGKVIAKPGVFSIFTPMDAHRGGIRYDARATEVLKLVVKIPVEEFSQPTCHEL